MIRGSWRPTMPPVPSPDSDFSTTMGGGRPDRWFVVILAMSVMIFVLAFGFIMVVFGQRDARDADVYQREATILPVVQTAGLGADAKQPRLRFWDLKDPDGRSIRCYAYALSGLSTGLSCIALPDPSARGAQ